MVRPILRSVRVGGIGVLAFATCARTAVARQHALTPMTSLVGTMKHVSTPSRKIVTRHTMSRPCHARVTSVS
eukprot:4626447-Prymnesium_polylepis.2